MLFKGGCLPWHTSFALPIPPSSFFLPGQQAQWLELPRPSCDREAILRLEATHKRLQNRKTEGAGVPVSTVELPHPAVCILEWWSHVGMLEPSRPGWESQLRQLAAV